MLDEAQNDGDIDVRRLERGLVEVAVVVERGTERDVVGVAGVGDAGTPAEDAGEDASPCGRRGIDSSGTGGDGWRLRTSADEPIEFRGGYRARYPRRRLGHTGEWPRRHRR